MGQDSSDTTFIRVPEHIISGKWAYIDLGNLPWCARHIAFTVCTYCARTGAEPPKPVFRIDFQKTDSPVTEYSYEVTVLSPCLRADKECKTESFAVHSAERAARSFRAGRKTFMPTQHKLGFRTKCTTHVTKGHFEADGMQLYIGNVPVSNKFRVWGRPGGTNKKHIRKLHKSMPDRSDEQPPRRISDLTMYEDEEYENFNEESAAGDEKLSTDFYSEGGSNTNLLREQDIDGIFGEIARIGRSNSVPGFGTTARSEEGLGGFGSLVQRQENGWYQGLNNQYSTGTISTHGSLGGDMLSQPNSKRSDAGVYEAGDWSTNRTSQTQISLDGPLYHPDKNSNGWGVSIPGNHLREIPHFNVPGRNFTTLTGWDRGPHESQIVGGGNLNHLIWTGSTNVGRVFVPTNPYGNLRSGYPTNGMRGSETSVQGLGVYQRRDSTIGVSESHITELLFSTALPQPTPKSPYHGTPPYPPTNQGAP